MSDIPAKAHQAPQVLIAVIGAGATPPVTPTASPRRWAIGSMRLITGRKV